MSKIPPLKCKNCNKEYNRESAFYKHKLLCSGCGGDPPTTLNGDESGDESNKLTHQPSEDEELGPLPLKDIVLELVKSNNKLRKDVEELKKWVNAKKKKLKNSRLAK